VRLADPRARMWLALPLRMLPLLAPLLLVAEAGGAPGELLARTHDAAPSGTLLWSNVSEMGAGQEFDSVLALPGGDVLLLVPRCATATSCGVQLGRLRPSTGSLVWSAPQPSGRWSLALGGVASAPVAVVWADRADITTVRAYDTNTGELLWNRDVLLSEAPIPIAVSSTALLAAGAVSNRGTELGVRAVALSLTDGSVLLNESVVKDNTTFRGCNSYDGKAACQSHGCGWNLRLNQCDRVDYFARSVAVVKNGTAAAAGGKVEEIALVGTEDGAIDAAGMIVAVGLADGSTRWTARNVTAATLHVEIDVNVLVAAVDTRPYLGQHSELTMLRGFSLVDGQLLWQRVTKLGGDNDPADGVTLGRACDSDCSLPCDSNLVAAGAFGVIDAKSGQTVYNLTSQPAPHAVANGVGYHLQQALAVGRTHAAGRGATTGSTRRNGPATLIATECGGNQRNVLWSARLPTGDDGGSAPFQKIVVCAAPSRQDPDLQTEEEEEEEEGGPVVLVGGHTQGQCFRGHCAPSHSAVAAFRGPGNGPPPPAPPAPSKCQAEMVKECAAAKKVSVDECEICCGEHAQQLHKVGCVDHDFQVFCHAAN
jgi:outer membrane protein assembly factor BamB